MSNIKYKLRDITSHHVDPPANLAVWPQESYSLQLPILVVVMCLAKSNMPILRTWYINILITSYNRYEHFRPMTPRSTVSSHTDPVLPRLPIAVDIYGDIRLRVAWIHTAAPHRVTANDDVALQHASRARGLPLPSVKGEKLCYRLS